jgi:hypothetical protein
MKWIKSYTSELDSTLLQEASAETFRVFYLLRLLAGREDRGGKIKYLDNQHLARLVNTKPEIIEKSLNYLQKTFRIKTHRFSEGWILKIVKWNIYQGVTETKPESRNRRNPGKRKAVFDGRGEERRGEEIRGDKIREEKSGESPPSTQKTEFFNLLRSLSGPSYPFQETEDGQVFDLFTAKYPKVNIIEQTKRKVEYWRENPSALRAHKKGPRTQLVDWLLSEVEYQDGRK